MSPERSLEVERKYDVDEQTAVPDWSTLSGVASVDAPELRELDALYFDTPDRALAHAGVALRRRTGGPDEGWHIKRSSAEGKHETRWPLDEGGSLDADSVPAAVCAELTPVSAGPFAPLARIENTRTAYALRTAEGVLLAEFVDDRVRGTDLAAGTGSSWREWEFELGPAAPEDEAARAALFDEVERRVTAAGGAVSVSGSKLARVLAG